MKKYRLAIPTALLLLVLMCITTVCTFSQGQVKDKKANAFSQKDVKHAQKLIGIEYTRKELDTLYRYLQRNLAGYDSMRKKSLDFDVLPAVYFDPHPVGFQIPAEQRTINWGQTTTAALPKNRSELAYFSIAQLAALIQSRQITSLELTQFFIDRIKQYDKTLHATITITEELALRQAKKADEAIANGLYKGPLHGIPFGVKDLIAVPEYRTTWGAAPYQDQMLDQKATLVKKLEDAGGVLIAKLTSGALARGDVWFGGKTVNPWDTLQGASGSSAGSGAATSAGLVPYSIGTETWGSILSPSSRCGVTGLRPTFGRVSRYGVMALSWSMDKVGPICRSAFDCALVFEAIRGRDEKDRTTVDASFNFDIEQDPAQFKVALLEAAMEKDTTAQGINGRRAIEVIRKLGISPEAVVLPEGLPFNSFDIILRSEAGAFFDELVRSNGDDKMVEQHQGSRANSLRQSRFIPAVEYLQANRYRTLLIEEMNDLMENYDVLISLGRTLNQSLITNLTGHPAISIPTGFDEKGRPTSITLIGNLYAEASILNFAHHFQIATDHDDKHPPLFSNE